ncbi:ATP-dependent protease ATP-binding subunit HslU [Tribonema minus]|uniref:ATP-dependent protease ATP-binding subunit HslU n=1 Tax=Tribonema minus TaxID=303371 RepID=A0A836CKX4_9STRA|nr:ATP-dependent protease ATP-binding subunit HslU [Tribonema minus]
MQQALLLRLPSSAAATSPLANGLGAALKPREVVDQLNKYIVGQPEAKRAVAIALRNRWRRHRLPEDLRNEVIPKNILMIGPTGCGKTEIARRLAKLSQAPFIKVLQEEAVCECGRGRAASDLALELPFFPVKREDYRIQLRGGEHATRTVTVDVPTDRGAANIMQVDQGSLAGAVKALGSVLTSKRTESKKMLIPDALVALEEAALDEMIDMGEVVKDAIAAVEQDGIVFLDEIDKICNASDYRGADASAEGVQRDLLPLIEGSAITTKHGNINTDFILFIGSGAFSQCKPSDLIAELQGRLPIRVELKGLTEEDMYRILTEPVTNLIRQQEELLAAENITLVFEDAAIREIARVAAQVNRTVENIGARRLHTVLERVVEEISFDAADSPPGTTITVTPELVRRRVTDMLIESDLSKYIL